MENPVDSETIELLIQWGEKNTWKTGENDSEQRTKKLHEPFFGLQMSRSNHVCGDMDHTFIVVCLPVILPIRNVLLHPCIPAAHNSKNARPSWWRRCVTWQCDRHWAWYPPTVQERLPCRSVVSAICLSLEAFHPSNICQLLLYTLRGSA